ncbi:hypothetical protein [Dietzia sp. 179-F 9C3 NHS]|uniref:hypothetical protein n=1 Tax=Dietzia sp. 179-F 9C3 NHS TaxID=3374295 RepID=UPI003878F635
MGSPSHYADTPWKEPLHDPGPAVVFDIDGVLADMRPFEHLIEAPTSREKEWKEFHKNFGRAKPIKAGLVTARRIFDELDIDLAYSTTRPEQHARRTLRWFERYDVPMGPVQFRHFVLDGPRPAVEVKLRHWWNWQERYAEQNPILAWIEDDPASLHALRAHGCPAWGPNELKSASRGGKSLRKALEAGPVDWDVLAAARQDRYSAWRADEDEWRATRRDWWDREKARQRQRRAARNTPRRGGH